MALRAALATAALLAPPAAAGPPVVTTILPRGGQRGTEIVLEFQGQRLDRPEGILFHGPGIEVLEVLPGDAKSAKVRIRIAPDCPLGRHLLRLRTARGLSGLKTFRVGTLAEVQEAEPQNDRGHAQPVALDSTVNGCLRSGDVDVFAVDVPAGEPIAFEFEGVRLGDALMDARLRVEDAAGALIATAEDSPLGLMDPVLVLAFAAPGRIFVEIADTALLGSDNSHYRLHVGRFPRPAGAVPAGGRPGETLDLRYLGPGAPPPAAVTLPASGPELVPHFAAGPAATAPSPTPILLAVSEHANVIEGAPAPESPREPPVALNGVLAAPGEEDRFEVRLAKGQEVEILSLSRVLRSPVDALIQVRAADGRVLAEADDNAGAPDARLAFRPPQDGAYTVVVRDQLRRGGAEWFYRVLVGPPRRPLRTKVVTSRRDDRTAVIVPRGGRMGVLLETDNASGDKTRSFEFTGLPAGVAAEADVLVPRRFNQAAAVFSAPEDAPTGAALAGATFHREGADPEDAGCLQVVPLLRVDNDDPYVVASVRGMEIAVADRLPFRVELEPPKVPLIRNTPMDLKVRVHRDAGFDKAVQVRMLWNPPGVNAGEIRVPGDRDEGALQLYCGGGAPAATWRIAVVGAADVDGEAQTCSALADLVVDGPFFGLDVGKAWVEQGQTVELPLTFKKRREFTSGLRPEIVNLPRGLTVEAPVFDQTHESGALKITAAPDAPCGRFKDLIIRFRVATADGDVLHHFRGGEIRIEKPTPKSEGTPAGGKRAWGTVENPKT